MQQSTFFQSHRRLLADILLLAVVFVWGITFVTVKSALNDIGVFSFLAIRFFIAFLFLAIIFRHKITKTNLPTLKAAMLIGFFLFAGYAFQTVGLLYTTASNAGFLTGMSVILVPCFSTLITRKSQGLGTIIGVCCAVIGMALLTLSAKLSLNFGDILVFFCAICFALHIVCVGQFAPKLDAKLLAVLQIGTTCLLSGIVGACTEPFPNHITSEVWVALLITAIPATALAFLIQNTMQQFTTASRTAIIFSAEPVFAALAGIYFLGEVLTLQQGIGCVLILAGTLLSELLPDYNIEHSSQVS